MWNDNIHFLYQQMLTKGVNKYFAWITHFVRLHSKLFCVLSSFCFYTEKMQIHYEVMYIYYTGNKLQSYGHHGFQFCDSYMSHLTIFHLQMNTA